MKKQWILVSLLFTANTILSQIGIGNTNPDATLDISASSVTTPNNNEGLLIPRVDDYPTNPTAAQNGMLVFFTGNGALAKGFYYWDHSTISWVAVTAESSDADWYEEGTSNSPSNNTDDIFTEGNVAIGKNTVDYPLEIESTTATRIINSELTGNITVPTYGHYLVNNNDGNGSNTGQYIGMGGAGITSIYGIDMEITATGPNGKTGYRVDFSGTGGGNKTGFRSAISNANSGNSYGLYTSLVGSGNADLHGVYNIVAGSGSGDNYGIKSAFNTNISGTKYGIHNRFVGTSTEIYGLFNDIKSDDNGNQYGVYTNMANNSNSNKYGNYQVIAGTVGNGNHYGSYNQISSVGSGEKYGSYIRIDAAAGGTHYGVYSNAQNLSGFAGYFLGRVSLGTGTSNRYIMPGTDGTANQIMATDGTGQISFIDASNIITDNVNTLDKAYDQGGAGAGKNITADNGAVRVDGTDGFLVTGTYGTGNSINLEIYGAGTRMFFNPYKAAFRAGYVDGNQWVDGLIGNYSIAMGYNTIASGIYSSAFGYETMASGRWSTVFGRETMASGDYAIALGRNTDATGDNSTAMGVSTEASGEFATAMGFSTIASGERSTSFGSNTTASGDYAIAMGMETDASGDNSTAMGYSTQATGFRATTMGHDTTASGDYTTAIGYRAEASGDNSIAMGYRTKALSYTETAVGYFNNVDPPSSSITWVSTDKLFSIGNGTSDGNRSNALTIYKNGRMNINDQYDMPLYDGIPGRVLTTNGSGTTSWQPVAEESSTASNGLTEVGDDIRLGGSLNQNTTITHGTNNMVFNVNSSGTFVVQDGGVDKLELNANGSTVLGGDLYWRDGNTATSSTVLGRFINDGNDGNFQIYENGNQSIILDANGTTIFNEQGFDRDFRIESDTWENIIRVDASENTVGIGTASPDYRFSVNGVANLMEDQGTGVALRVQGHEALWYDGTRFSWGYGGTSNTFADDVGIGMTAVPSYKLEVQDNPVSDYVTQIYNTSTNANADGLKIRLGNNSNPGGSNAFIAFFHENTGLGTQIGSIRGNGSGGVSYNTTSDRRLKTHIEDISEALSIIAEIQPRIYEFKTNLGTKEFGFIAQELQLVYPQAVTGSPDSDPTEEPMMVDYSRLTPILTAGIKELYKELQQLKESHASLKASMENMKSMEERLEKLEAYMLLYEEN